VPDSLLEELYAWLRIPSISSGDGDPADLERAARWVCDRIEEAGGSAAVVPTAGNPLAVGELRSFLDDAPTVLIYGHYDVQSVQPIAEWHSHPFEPEVRDGRLYARGASDDKGNFLPLLHVACRLALAGELPVHVRVLVEGEEEVGGHHALDWLEADERGADCAIVFDSGMEDEDTPALTIGVRGIIQLAVDVRTAPRNLHSGMYGGAALNASHALLQALAPLLPNADGLLRDELREGRIEPTADERESWAALDHGSVVLEEVGATPLSEAAANDFYVRNWSEPSFDINGIAAGDAQHPRTILLGSARAMISIRLAPGQDATQIRDTAERLIREATPAGAELEITRHGLGRPAMFDPALPAMRLARAAIHRATGSDPVLVRSGGSIPILATLADRGIPTVLSGFSLAADDLHAPNESYRLASLYLGEEAAGRLYAALSELLPNGG
jgi:acetylornithine deacetylase/succinyl-diaminopimelate desuccinylase-like protein